MMQKTNRNRFFTRDFRITSAIVVVLMSKIYYNSKENLVNVNMDEEQLQEIGKYIKSRLNQWIDEVYPNAPVTKDDRDREINLIERIVRVEEELKAQRELMQQGFAQMDKRFEDLIHYMDKRFEQVDKRFAAIDQRFEDLIHYMDKRFEQVDKRIDQVDKHLAGIDENVASMRERMDRFDQRFEDLHNALRRFMIWSFGTSISLAGIVIAVLKLT